MNLSLEAFLNFHVKKVIKNFGDCTHVHNKYLPATRVSYKPCAYLHITV